MKSFKSLTTALGMIGDYDQALRLKNGMQRVSYIRAPFGTSKNTAAQVKRNAAKKKAFKRAKRLGHA